ncbi:dynamin family protein [Streptomyces sp. NPDC048255]|uniref:dynamin family protein n=1 Tax=Streptomyces sp. NPDC048255 TaxID=3154713 RepID=UPI0033DBA38B
MAAHRAAARQIIDQLRDLAAELELERVVVSARSLADAVSDGYRIMVLGAFNTGKSTLVNALLAETVPSRPASWPDGPLVAAPTPATSVLTSVHYAAQPSVVARGHDGSERSWPFERFRSESTPDGDADTQQLLSGIREFEVGYPALLCRAGVTLYDCPGLDDLPMRNAITQEAMRRCHAVLLVIRNDMLISLRERDAVRELSELGVPTLLVVNLYHRRHEEQFLERVWKTGMVDAQDGPPATAHRNLADHNVHLVDVREAWLSRSGRSGGSHVGVTELAALESRLGDVLDHGECAHRAALLGRVMTLADDLAHSIVERRHALRADASERRAHHDRAAVELAALRERSRRIDYIVNRTHDEAERLLIASFAETVTSIRADLPGHLRSLRLPSETVALLVFQQTRLLEEAAAEVSDFVGRRIRHWGEEIAPPVLRPLLDHMGELIEGELDLLSGRIQDAGLGDLRLEMRNLSGLTALGSTRAVALSTSVTLAVLSVAPVLFWPTVLVAGVGLTLVRASAADRIKAKVLLQADEQLAELSREMEGVIREQLADVFAQSGASVAAVLDEAMGQLARMAVVDRADRDAVLATLDAAGERLADLVRRLEALRRGAPGVGSSGGLTAGEGSPDA